MYVNHASCQYQNKWEGKGEIIDLKTVFHSQRLLAGYPN